MKKIHLALLSASAIALALPAQAADVTVAAPDWTGFYVGVGVGAGLASADLQAAGFGEYYDYLDVEDEDYENFDGVNFYSYDEPNFQGYFGCSEDQDYCEGETGVLAALTNDAGQAGFLGRGEVGFDYQVDRIVMGVNGSFTVGSRTMDSSAAGDGGGNVYTDEGFLQDVMVGGGGGAGETDTELKMGNSWSIGARLGYLLTDSTLLFAAGGYTQTKVELKASFEGESGAGAMEYDSAEIFGSYNVSSSADEWLGGYYVGGGLETLMTDHVSLKLEYRYTDLGSIKTSKEVSCGDCGEGWNWATGVAAEADIVDHSVMATVSFRM